MFAHCFRTQIGGPASDQKKSARVLVAKADFPKFAGLSIKMPGLDEGKKSQAILFFSFQSAKASRLKKRVAKFSPHPTHEFEKKTTRAFLCSKEEAQSAPRSGESTSPRLAISPAKCPLSKQPRVTVVKCRVGFSHLCRCWQSRRELRRP